jgi:small-conductance mechanosensitive channel
VNLVAEHPNLYEALLSLIILCSSYLGARVVSYLIARLLMQSSGTPTLTNRIGAAIQHPLTYALFLAGAYGAVHRLPLPPHWTHNLDECLAILAFLMTTIVLLRAYGIFVTWYTTESNAAASGSLATELGPLANKLGKTFIVIVAVIAGLQYVGVNVASLMVSLGVGSLAIGLAAQDTLSNMFAGFTLMVDRPFHIGDRIQLATGEVGDVETVGMRATRIRTLDETSLIVPNSILIKERLINQSRPTSHITTRIELGVAYGSDLALVSRILGESALSSDHVDRERTPIVQVTRFGEIAIQFLLIFWVKDYRQQGQAKSDVATEVDRRLREAGIEIPVSTRRVIQQSGPAPAAGPPAGTR